MELKKFIDIERAKLSYVETFEIGEPIVCEVKVDGSNASFCYDAKNKTVAAFSRRKQLDVSNTLNGFFEFTQGFNEDVIEEVLGTRYIVFGEWLCLSGDTVIKKVSAGKGKKEMTLKEMYEYAHTPETGRGKSWWERNGYPSLYCLDLETDTIQPNKMQEIVYTGKKKVYKLTTHKGYSIKATSNHPFLTPKGWVELGKLSEYDCVAITDFITRNVHQRTYGMGTRKIFKKQKEYKDRVGKCEKCGAINGLNLHHRDENPFHNTEDNWQVLCQDCHGNSHTKFNNQPKFDYEFDYIISIEDVGEEDCYDICMSGNENVANFIANNFIVHNCKHTVQYPDHMYKKFYMYDVWDRETEQYLPYEETVYFYNKLAEGGITMEFVNTLYIGEFKSWEHILSLLEMNTYGEKPCMEGVVIKRQSRLDSRSSRLPYYVKVVNEQFSEVHDTHVKKNIDPEKLKEIEAQKALVAAIVTERRCQKILEKMIEDNIIPADWGSEHMKDIAKNMPKLAFEDCRKEEPELISKVDNFGKYCSQIAMSHVKKFLASK